MADRRVRYVLEVDYDSKSVLMGAADDLRDVDDAARQVEEGLEKSESGFSKLQASVVTAQSALALVKQGFGYVQQAAEMAYEAIKGGAGLIQAEEQFGNLAASIGTTADALQNDLAVATAGLQSNAEMVAGAGQLMSLGLAKSHDEVVALSEVSGQLGWDIQVLGLTIANQSTARLDALGLSIESVTSKIPALREQGLSADEAFKWAIIEAGREKIDVVGSTADTTAGKIEILENIVEDVQDEFARGAAEGFADTLSVIATNAPAAGDGLSYAARGASYFLTQTLGTALLMTFSDELIWLMEKGQELEKQEQLQTAQMALLADEGMYLAESMGYAGEKLEQLIASQLMSAEAADWQMAAQAGVVAQYEIMAAASAMAAEEGQYLYDSMMADAAAAEELAAKQAAAGEAAQLWADYVEDANRRGSEAFQWAQGQVAGFEMPEMEPLIIPQRELWITTRVSGPTEEDAAYFDEYADLAARAQERIDDLTHGVGTYGMTQEEVNKKIEAASGELAYYQGLMGAIPPVVEEATRVTQEMAINQDALNLMLYNQAAAYGATAGELGNMAVSMGLMEQAEADAVTAGAQTQIIVENLGGAARDGKISWEEYGGAVQMAIDVLNGMPLVEPQPVQIPEMPTVDPLKLPMMPQIDDVSIAQFLAEMPEMSTPLHLTVEQQAVQDAVNEAKGIVDGFVDPEEVYQAVMEMDIEDVEEKAGRATELIEGIPEYRSVVVDVTVRGMALLEELQSMGVIP